MTDAWKPLPADQLNAALAGADYRVLLMALFQMTGDRRWLHAPFNPQRDVSLIADHDAGLSEEARAEIRAAAVALLSRQSLTPAIDDPDDETMLEMMRGCLGEVIAPEYVGMMREEMGFRSRQVTWSDPMAPARAQQRLAGHPVIIVGAGASGIALGANLEALGIPFVILEKNDEVGGTWYENAYPGCAVDTPSHAYSFSFGERQSWSRYFSPRAELLDYMKRSADEAGLRPHIRFGCRVTRSDWDESASCWRVTVETPDGVEELRGMCLVSAIGQLSQPSLPTIDGADSFTGRLFHPAAWPEDLDLTGKNLAIVGTGATAMQIVPTVVDTVASVTVYQRNPQWVRPIPHYHDPISDHGQWLLRHVPYYGAWYRFTMLYRFCDGLLPTLRKDPNWPEPERALNQANDRHRQEMTAHMIAELGDRQDLLEKCLPTYPPYGKRILLDNGWYKAITKPNAELVTEDIARITPGGIVTVDGNERAADIIVLATGFTVSLLAARLNITGRDGQALADAWAGNDPRAHLGITMPGFPNLFCMQGPNTGLGHGGSAIFQSECQARYIAGCITRMIEQGLATIDVKQAVQDAYVARVDAEHERMIWTHPGMSTYYRNAKGRVVSVMPWRLVDYWSMTREPDLTEYHVTHQI